MNSKVVESAELVRIARDLCGHDVSYDQTMLLSLVVRTSTEKTYTSTASCQTLEEPLARKKTTSAFELEQWKIDTETQMQQKYQKMLERQIKLIKDTEVNLVRQKEQSKFNTEKTLLESQVRHLRDEFSTAQKKMEIKLHQETQLKQHVKNKESFKSFRV